LADASAARIPRLRWGIGVLLGVGVLINYFDRFSLSVRRRSWSATSRSPPITSAGC